MQKIHGAGTAKPATRTAGPGSKPCAKLTPPGATSTPGGDSKATEAASEHCGTVGSQAKYGQTGIEKRPKPLNARKDMDDTFADIQKCMARWGVAVARSPDGHAWEFRHKETDLLLLRWWPNSRKWSAFSAGNVFKTGATPDPWLAAQIAAQVKFGYETLLVPPATPSLYEWQPFVCVAAS